MLEYAQTIPLHENLPALLVILIALGTLVMGLLLSRKSPFFCLPGALAAWLINKHIILLDYVGLILLTNIMSLMTAFSWEVRSTKITTMKARRAQQHFYPMLEQGRYRPTQSGGV